MNTGLTRGIILMALGLFLFSAVDTMCKVLTETLHPLQILRGFSSITSACSFIFALQYVSLAEAVAVDVSVLAPFFVVLMGVSILKENVGLCRWLSIVVGFIGALIITSPGSGVCDPATILVLIAAFAFAGRQVLSRFLSNLDSLSTTIAYTALT